MCTREKMAQQSAPPSSMVGGLTRSCIDIELRRSFCDGWSKYPRTITFGVCVA